MPGDIRHLCATELQHPRPATGVSQALRARSVSGVVPRVTLSAYHWGPRHFGPERYAEGHSPPVAGRGGCNHRAANNPSHSQPWPSYLYRATKPRMTGPHADLLVFQPSEQCNQTRRRPSIVLRFSLNTTMCHENITQFIRKTSNRVTVIKSNSTRTGFPGG